MLRTGHQVQPPVEMQRSLELCGGPSSFDGGRQVLMGGGGGGMRSEPCLQAARASSLVVSTVPMRQSGRIWQTRLEEAAAEANKTEGVSCTAL